MSTATDQCGGQGSQRVSPAPQLRNSCDTCNIAKVKCSQTRPSCSRCEARELYCVYSVSLRSIKQQSSATRKPRSKSDNNTVAAGHNGNVNSAGNIAVPPLSIPYSAPPLPLSIQTGSPAFQDPSFDSSLLDSWTTDFLDAGNLSPFSTMEDVDEPMAFFPHVIDISGSHQDRDHAFHSFRHEQSGSEAAKPVLTATPLMEYRVPTLSSLSSALHVQTNNICGCQQSILSKLLELSRSKYGTPTPFDKSLSENKAIIALCNSVLNCGVVQHGEDIVLMLTLIALVSHLITVYDVLFRPFTKTRNCPSSASSTFSSNRSADGSGFVTPNTPTSSRDAMLIPRDLQAFSSVRLSLGSYQLDQKDEQILQINLVKIELGKIGGLIEGFGRRFIKGDEEWDGGGGDGRQPETRALGELLGYLHGRLRSHHEALRSWSSGL